MVFFCQVAHVLHFTGSRIMLKETTLMPHIHGLPALITMLFTPVMELRYIVTLETFLRHMYCEAQNH